jgi:ABC-2 type transport system ATP-binding protein
MPASATSSTPAIAVRALSKRYGKVTALSELSFEVASGEIFGFLGLNGAGKTTTIRTLLDLVRPDSGNASIFGVDCQKNGKNVRAQIGYLPGEFHLAGDLTGSEVLDLTARLRGVPVRAPYCLELQSRLELSESVLKRKLREYSTGMKRKLGLLQALQGDPRLLIFDEPTEGLDPLMQDAFYRILSDLQERGRTVFMSSHVLSEVERVCHRIALIRNGSLVLISSVEELRAVAPRLVRVRFSQDVPSGPAGLPPNFQVLARDARSWSVSVSGPAGELVKRLQGLPVADLDIAEPRLEDMVMRYYREAK